jgi:hypothetical protein
MSVLKLPLLVDLQQKVRELVLSLFFNQYFSKYFKLLYRKYVAMVTTGIGFSYSLACTSGCWVILRRWSVCAPTASEVVHDCQKFEKRCFKAKGKVHLCCLRSDDAYVITCVANLMEVKVLYVQQDLRYEISSHWRFDV